MAAKFGATIIPFAAIGADEGINQILDAADLTALGRQLPFLGQRMQSRQSDIPPARVGVNATMDDERSFVSPLISFNPPSRFYYIFRKPIQTTPDMAQDREASDLVYKHVKGEVEGGLGYLLRMREQDPYKDFVPRLLYELSRGGREQAPSFKP